MSSKETPIPSSKCTAHKAIEAELSHMEKSIEDEVETRKELDTETSKELKELTQRIRALELKVARWGGAIAIIAALPLVIKIIGSLVPIAAANW